MGKLISFMHVSLDGFVAGPNGEMNWIKAEPEIFEHVDKRICKGDTAMYGRVTYRLMENYWPEAGKQPNATEHAKSHSQWYNNVHKIVVSESMKNMQLTNTTIISDKLSDRINEIKRQETKEILLFGSPTTTHSLIQLDLIDGYWLFVNPIILGNGIPLFNDIKDKINLKLLPGTRQFKCGVTELHYEVDKRNNI